MKGYCGASATSVCVFLPGHDGLCSYHTKDVENRALRAVLERLYEAATVPRGEHCFRCGWLEGHINDCRLGEALHETNALTAPAPARAEATTK